MANLKQLNDKVLGVSGFTIPVAGYFGGLNPDDVQMAYIANAVADDVREYAPQKTRLIFQVNLTSATTYTLPDDFLAYIPDTMYELGRRDPVLIPVTPSQWAEWLANDDPSGLYIRARFLNNALEVMNPEDGATIQFEYLSSASWVSSDGLTAKEQADTDTDVTLYDRVLMEKGIQWRWKKEKGLPDWQIDEASWRGQVVAWKGRDNGARTLCFAEYPGFYFGQPYANGAPPVTAPVLFTEGGSEVVFLEG